jgi:hypothetical protein
MQNKYLKTIFNLLQYSSTQSVLELAEIDLIYELVVNLSKKKLRPIVIPLKIH